MKTSRILCFYFGGVEFNKRLYARSCGDFILVPPDTEIFRTVDFGEIFWPVSGQCSFRMEGREWTVRPGYLWYYPPGAHHEYNPLNPFHYCWLAVGGTGAGPFFDLMGIEPGINRAGLCPQRLFLQLGNEINSRTPQGRYASLNTTFRIVSQVNFLSRTAKDKEGSLMEEAKAL
ncbi:MAG: AraC family ligand binding domain-containing protein, partial [Victivallales bacterium]|nr:AraC family ligand binding domain-containing protein [Victivallales bacterium]